MQHVAERFGERLRTRIVGRSDRIDRGLAGRKDEAGVGGRGVAVDGHRVERAVDQRLQQRLQHRRRDRRVGEHETQHRRHVRRDHARALGDARDRDRDAVEVDGGEGELGIGVGGHDRLGRVHPRTGGEAQRSFARNAGELVCGSSGSPMTPVEARKISSGGDVERGARRSRPNSFTVSLALHAGEGIGIAGIDQQAARPRPRDCRGTSRPAPTGIWSVVNTPGDRRAFVERGEQHVGAVLVLDAGFGSGEAHARDLGQLRIGLGREGRNGMGHLHAFVVESPMHDVGEGCKLASLVLCPSGRTEASGDPDQHWRSPG